MMAVINSSAYLTHTCIYMHTNRKVWKHMYKCMQNTSVYLWTTKNNKTVCAYLACVCVFTHTCSFLFFFFFAFQNTVCNFTHRKRKRQQFNRYFYVIMRLLLQLNYIHTYIWTYECMLLQNESLFWRTIFFCINQNGCCCFCCC